jgi:hypothetical protein
MSKLKHKSLPAQQSIGTITQSSVQMGMSACHDHCRPPVQTPLTVFTIWTQVPCIALLALIAPTSLWLTNLHRNLARVDVFATATCLVTALAGANCALGNLPYI